MLDDHRPHGVAVSSSPGDGSAPNADASARQRCALILMSVPLQEQVGPVAVWITAAGWAAGSRRVLGGSWLMTPEGELDVNAARARASKPSAPAPARRARRIGLPNGAKVLLKDLRAAVRAYRFGRKVRNGSSTVTDLAFVWQRHDLFQFAGLAAARRFGCPLVLFVDAPIVWEARRWGVRRRGWGRLLEMIAEKPILRRADLVACVSGSVAEEVRRLGASPERVIVTPCSVDTDVFHIRVDGRGVRTGYGLDGSFVVGWTGSFRRFHGLESLLEAFRLLQDDAPHAALLLVGDGPERQRLEAVAAEKGISNVVFTGTVPHDDIPSHIGAMDAAVVTAPADADFHYSPLKLKEYMACGRPVVAPRIGQVPSAIVDREEGMLVPPGDAERLAHALRVLSANPERRCVMGEAAAARVLADGTWEHQVRVVMEQLFPSRRC